MITHSACPLCSSGKISFYLRCTDHFFSKEEFDLYECAECGFIFTHVHPDEQDMDRYYESAEYISHDDNAQGTVNRIYFLVRRIMLSKKRRMIKNATGFGKGKLLDLGCGTGYFAGTMRNAGWDVTGVERNQKARDFCKQKFDIDCIEPIKISELPSGVFDCITLWHVLEHLDDPFFIIREIKRLLKRNGICIIAVPNCASVDSKYYREYWAAYDVPRHLWHFTSDTFALFAEKSRIDIKEIQTLPLDLFYISILSEKYSGSRIYLLKGLIKGTLFSFYSLFSRKKSSSLIYILQ